MAQSTLDDPDRDEASTGLGFHSMSSVALLDSRPRRPADYQAENSALVALAQRFAAAPERLLQKLADTALTLCRAHSAGLSLLENEDQRQTFRWRAVAGRWSSYLDRQVPRNSGPCGIVVAHDSAFVCRHPERDFSHVRELDPPVEEALLTPFHVDGEPIGAIWVVAHDASRRFDKEDLRRLTNLGPFAAAAYRAKWYRHDRERKQARLDEVVQSASLILDGLPEPVYITDASGRLIYYNTAATEFWGYHPELGNARWCGSWRLFNADGTSLPYDECPMAVAIKENRPVRNVEAIAERPDGTRRPFLPYPTPLRDATGKLIGAVNMLVDITERKEAEETAYRLASIVESSEDAIVGKDLNGTITSWNKGAELLFGYVAGEAIGKPIGIVIPDERQHEQDNILQRIKLGQRVEHFETVRMRKDASRIAISLSVSPIRDRQGRIVGASKIARDISARKRAEAHIAVLAREAEHRTKNILANVQATVRLTRAETVEDFKRAIEGRIQALANVHKLFVQSRWQATELRTVIEAELAAYSSAIAPQLHIAGPSVMLEPTVAQAVAVSIHELATNAAKYGALSVPQGQLWIEWSRDHNGRLLLLWKERGGPPVETPPSRRGFGTLVMENMISALRGSAVRFDWHTEGLMCELTLQL